MKVFIEVTILANGKKVLLNINNVRDITQGGTICFENDYYYTVKETYEEIKQLIINAQK